MIKKINITKYLNFTILLFTATFIIKPSLGRDFFYLATILWILEANFKDKLTQVFRQKTILFYFLIILLYLISLSFSDTPNYGFWSDKFDSGYEYLYRQKYFLISLFIATSFQKQYIRFLPIVYLIQITYMVTYSFGIKFQFFKGDKYSSVYDPCIYLDHTHYSIALALGIIFAIYLFISEKNKSIKIVYGVLTLYLIANIFIIAGRLGQIGVIFSIFLMAIYYLFQIKKQKYILNSLMIVVVLAVVPYYLSTTYKNRMLAGINDLKLIKNNNYISSWGVRVGFDIVSLDYLTSSAKYFVFGAGMGEAKSKFKNFILKKHQDKKVLLKYEHVHNQFFQSWINGGLFALFCFIMIFYSLSKLKIPLKEKTLLFGIITLYTIDSSANLIFYRVISLEIFAIAIGLLLAFERIYTQKQLLSQT